MKQGREQQKVEELKVMWREGRNQKGKKKISRNHVNVFKTMLKVTFTKRLKHVCPVSKL